MLQTREYSIQKLQIAPNQASSEESDIVAVEEPLQVKIRFASDSEDSLQNFSLLLRTPGNDRALVSGLFFNEGLIDSRKNLLNIRHCPNLDADNFGNNLLVELTEDVRDRFTSQSRTFLSSSACGLCGTKSTNEFFQIPKSASDNFGNVVEDSVLHSSHFSRMIEALDRSQTVFSKTGGMHAAAEYSYNGDLLSLAEDIGRHNALDKLIGSKVLDGSLDSYQTEQNSVLLMSSRLSFEIVQKAIRGKFKIVLAFGAPSSLAIDLARMHNITLVGFLRKNRFNVYSHPERLKR